LIHVARVHGLAAGHIHRYRCVRIHIRGDPLYTPFFMHLNLDSDLN